MNDVAINPELIAAHGLNAEEWQRVLDILGREPSFTELGIFSAMWNEHCSYKSSKKWLKTLPTEGPQVICGPGENAGVVDIGDGQAVVFKMESHNHPSYISPFDGAATGVGGILRDVFTMGARPIAAMDSLSFGAVSHPRTPDLVQGAVDGIRFYGGTFGVPIVGGELRFHSGYDGNCLVNAFVAGIVETDRIFYSAASGVGMPVVYLGAKTGRDGVGGATMASAEFGGADEPALPEMVKGDPEIERRLYEACLELMDMGAVISIQDMGAAGLTCSAVEMGDKGGLGIELVLDQVPQRDDNMSAYEMMLSESQERMLMVLRPEKEEEARAVFAKWRLDFVIIGTTLEEDRFIIRHGNEIKADIPLSKLSSQAPEYDRPWVAPPAPAPLGQIPAISAMDGLKALISSPNYAHRGWLFDRYATKDSNPDILAGPGISAGVVRISHGNKALAFTSDVTPRYVQADAHEGGKQAVAEAYRNLIAVGAHPLATTDNLNFGNPERPETMGQLVGAIKGISEAVKALDMPIVSGNVSLYNETDGNPIPPTPTIGAVGILASLDDLIAGHPTESDIAVLVGETTGHLGQSALLAEAFGIEAGDAPRVDLAAEKRHGEFVRQQRRNIIAASDLSDGGLALAAFEMADHANVGVILDVQDIPSLFGEDQARYLLAVPAAALDKITQAAKAANVPLTRIGRFGGNEIIFGSERAPLADLSQSSRDAVQQRLNLNSATG